MKTHIEETPKCETCGVELEDTDPQKQYCSRACYGEPDNVRDLDE